ncbi:hypothetical protein [Lonepinella sp. BR2357]|uniref:hypothetical protein n=1 Tax=Lonepinella sp. BR2357 TaxID=3434549 RepID=UPI003F6DC82F
MCRENIEQFFSQFDFDIRKSNDARWIDQKCTYDVVNIIADCILEFTQHDTNKSFTVTDIWRSDYAVENVQIMFSKPDPSEKSQNEYDKYFSQPIKLLSYSRILRAERIGLRYLYKINNLALLEHIALKPTNALNFLISYIQKVLADSGLDRVFNQFFQIQSKDAYAEVRKTFIDFTIDHTAINTTVECGRIFTKIINPLAFKFKKYGTEKGRISNKIITMQDIQYNRTNWRDDLSGKEKHIPRQEYAASTAEPAGYSAYLVQKAKKDIRNFNDRFRNGLSEVFQQTEQGIKATQMHHIFPQSDFPTIAAYLENLIALTPNQHYAMAHPDNKTMYIDKDFQYICLLAKCGHIMDNLTNPQVSHQIYDFDSYTFVLDTGLNTDKFGQINDLDFSSIVLNIDYFYSEYSNVKFNGLIKNNKPIFK